MKRLFKEEISEDFKKNVLDRGLEFRYMMMDRLKQDAEYYFRNPSDKHLWALNPIEHADDMIALYNSFSHSEKPKWLTDKELKTYVTKLKSMNK